MANMAAGSRYDLTLVQGATFYLKFSYQNSSKVPISLSGYTARLQVRTDHDASTASLELTTENGGIILNSPSIGDIVLKLSNTATSAISFATGVYDLELIHSDGPDTIVDNILYGTVSVRRNVTR